MSLFARARADQARTYKANDAARYTQIQIERRNQVNARSRQLGSRSMFRGILDTSQLESMTNQDIIDLFESNGYDVYENNGRVHVKNAKGDTILRTDPPDSGTNYHHVHLYNNNKQLLDKDLTIVEKDDSAGHIKYGGPGNTDDNNSSGGSGGNNIYIPKPNDELKNIMPDGAIAPLLVDIPVFPQVQLPLPAFVF